MFFLLSCQAFSGAHTLYVRTWQVKLPLDPGTRVDCRWRDGQMYPARVIERRPAPNGIDHEYYMHYIKCAPGLLTLPAAGAMCLVIGTAAFESLLWSELSSGSMPCS